VAELTERLGRRAVVRLPKLRPIHRPTRVSKGTGVSAGARWGAFSRTRYAMAL
jgi:hypothetical protein